MSVPYVPSTSQECFPKDRPLQSINKHIADTAAGRAFQVDVTSAEAVEAAVNAQIKEFNGRLDVFVANAGIPWTQGPAVDGELEHYRKVVANDLDSVFYCARTCGRIWRRQRETGADLEGNRLEGYGGGSFVATASMSGHIVNVPQLQAAYNAAKAGVSHMCELCCPRPPP